jgi:hypothetical protein
MSALSIQPTYPIFTETDGLPLENGYIWIGTANLDPQVNPINVYWDAALTILAPQPIRTINGYPSRSGTPGRLYVNSNYSIRVQDSKGSLVYSAPAATERYSDVVLSNLDASSVNYTPAGANALPMSVQTALREYVSVFDFMTEAEKTDVRNRTQSLDVWQAIQNAINACAEQVGGVAQTPIAKAVYFPYGDYLITKPINMTADNGQANRRGIRLFSGKAGSGDYVYGTKIVGQTSGKAVIEIIDNDNCEMENLVLTSTLSSGATVGIYQARRTAGVSPSQWCGNCIFRNITITFLNDGITQNNNFGTIGIINVAGEETTYERCEVWTNCPLVLTWSNSFRKSVSALTPTTYDTFAYNPYWATQADITNGSSNTIFRTIACRFIAKGFNAPIVLMHEVGSVYMYGDFLQKRASTTGVDSTNGVGYEFWNANQIVIDSATENTKTPILTHRAFSSVTMNLRGVIGSCPGPAVGILHFLPDAPSFPVTNTEITVQYVGGTPDGFMTYATPSGVGPLEPAVYTWTNCVFKTDALRANSYVDPKIIYKSRNVNFEYSDISWKTDEGYIRIPLRKKNIGKNVTTGIATIVLPTVIANLSACSVGVTAYLQASNVGPGVGNPSSASAQIQWQIVRDPLPTSTTVLGFAQYLNVTSYNAASNNIAGVSPAEVSPGFNNVELQITTSITGTDQADIFISGYLELIYAGGYSDAPTITLL